MISLFFKYLARKKLKKYLLNKKYKIEPLPDQLRYVFFVDYTFSDKEKLRILNLNQFTTFFKKKPIIKKHKDVFSNEIYYHITDVLNNKRLKRNIIIDEYKIKAKEVFDLFLIFQEYEAFGSSFYFVQVNLNISPNAVYFIIDSTQLKDFSDIIFSHFFEYTNPKFKVEDKVKNF